MAIDPAAAAGATGATALGKNRLASNFDTFLSLLTTQLKNQDPLAPMDSTQFTQQLVQMSSVEQQLLTNDLLETVVRNTGTGISTAVSLIGKEVRALSHTAELKAGKAEWTYNLPNEAVDLKLEVLDQNGRVVQASAPSDRGAGDHVFTWDGKTQTGTIAPEGVYMLRVTALDADGNALPTTTYVEGLVSAVEQADGDTLITVNGSRVSWSTVKSITQPAPTNPQDAG